MGNHTPFMVRATAQPQRGLAVIWVGWPTPRGLAVWRWELLRVLWQAMSTVAATRFAVEQYRQAYPAVALTAVPALEGGIAGALLVLEVEWPFSA